MPDARALPGESLDLFGGRPEPLIRRRASLSACGRLRFTLTREWDERPKVCFIGHNPSTADHRQDDPTVRRWMHFACAWGYGGFVAVNLYPLRSPDPGDARRRAESGFNGDWGARDELFENLGVLVCEAKRAGLVVACWGAIATDDGWNEHVIEEVTTGIEPWPSVHVFGLTKGGAPIHPLARGRNRVPDNAQPIQWRGLDV